MLEWFYACAVTKYQNLVEFCISSIHCSNSFKYLPIAVRFYTGDFTYFMHINEVQLMETVHVGLELSSLNIKAQ